MSHVRLSLQFSVVKAEKPFAPNLKYSVISHFVAAWEVIGKPHEWNQYEHLHEALADAGRRANEANVPDYLDTKVFVQIDEIEHLYGETP